MTSEEKAKLYEAIGYTEGVVDLQLPEEYVAITMHFNLKMLEVCVRNEMIKPTDLDMSLATVLSLQVSGVTCEIDQRPASSGLKYESKSHTNLLFMPFHFMCLYIFMCSGWI